jgi:hypothetical protein
MTLVQRPFVAPPGAGVVLIGVYPAPNNSGDGQPSIVSWVAGDWLEVTNAHLEQRTTALTADTNPVTGIFHGALPDTGTDDYAWTGAADASASTRTHIAYRENLFINPAAVTDNQWGAWAGTAGVAGFTSPTGQSGWALGTATAFRMTWTTPPTPPNGGGIYTDGYRHRARLTRAVVQARCSRAQRLMFSIQFQNASGYVGGGADQEILVAANTVNTFSVKGVCPAGADRMLITLYNWNGAGWVTWAAGDWLEATNMHWEDTTATLTPTADPVTGIFNGNLADTKAVEYAWSGAANASRSQRYEPPRLTWDAATCFGGPLPSSGRWADVSASLRWDDTAPAITWDTWPY